MPPASSEPSRASGWVVTPLSHMMLEHFLKQSCTMMVPQSVQAGLVGGGASASPPLALLPQPSAVVPSAPMLHPEAEQEQDLISWLAMLRTNTRLEPHHPVQVRQGSTDRSRAWLRGGVLCMARMGSCSRHGAGVDP